MIAAKGKIRFIAVPLSLMAAFLLSFLPPAVGWAQEGEPTGEPAGKVYLPLVAGAPTSDPRSQLAQQALTLVATQNQLALTDVTLLHSTTNAYTLLGKTVYAFKVLAQSSGVIYAITLDAGGQAVDEAALLTQEQALYAAQFGGLDPTLVTALANRTNANAMRVIIWLKTPEYQGVERPEISPVVASADVTSGDTAVVSSTDRENQRLAETGLASDTLADGQSSAEATPADATVADAPVVAAPVDNATAAAAQAQQAAFLAQVDAQRASVVAQVTAPVIGRLRSLGAVQVAADGYAPALYAELTPDAIRTVAGWREVEAIFPEQYAQPALDIARRTVYAHTVNSRGFTGSGLKVAQIEVGGLIAINNPYLSGVIQDYTYGCSHPHGTWVAGAIRSTHSSVRGIAPGVSLWAGGSCTGSNSELQNRSTAAANWGALVLNLSLGADSSRTTDNFARFYDDMVINRYRTVVIAAGNIGAAGCPQGTTGNVMTPGTAYNVITVGNFDDKNSTSWSGDAMNPCSSWRDPLSANGDREKPEIAAPGTNIKTTSTVSPWTGDNVTGTSFAAPMVAATAALLIQRNNTLASWPEAVKAILMATAVHNIEGSARLSEYDGAGGLVAHYADDVARGVNGRWGAQNYTCSTASALNVTTMSLTAGRRTRVVIVWDNDPAYSGYASQPGADLDLAVLNSAGSVVANSVSYDNTYEIVDFTPSTSGNYTLRVNRVRCSYNPKFLGWAWFRS